MHMVIYYISIEVTFVSSGGSACPKARALTVGAPPLFCETRRSDIRSRRSTTCFRTSEVTSLCVTKVGAKLADHAEINGSPSAISNHL
jgi:hypothetical protein